MQVRWFLIAGVMLAWYWFTGNQFDALQTNEDSETGLVKELKNNTLQADTDTVIETTIEDSSIDGDKLEPWSEAHGKQNQTVKNEGSGSSEQGKDSKDNYEEDRNTPHDRLKTLTRAWHRRVSNHYIPAVPLFDLDGTLGTVDQERVPLDTIYQQGITGEDEVASMQLFIKCNNYNVALMKDLQEQYGKDTITVEDIEPKTRHDLNIAYEACFFIAIQYCRSHKQWCSDPVRLITTNGLYVHPDQRTSHYAWSLVGLYTGILKKLPRYKRSQESISAIPHDIREESYRRAIVLMETILADEWNFEDFKVAYWGDVVFTSPVNTEVLF